MEGLCKFFFYSITATAISVFITLLAAYPMSKKDLVGRKFFNALFVITMFLEEDWFLHLFWWISFVWLIQYGQFCYQAHLMYGIWYWQEPIISLFPMNYGKLRRLMEKWDTVLLPDFTSTLQTNHCSSGIMGICWNVEQLFWCNDLFKWCWFAAITVSTSFHFGTKYTSIRNDCWYSKYAEMAKMAELLKYSTIVVSSIPLLVMYPFFQKYFDKGVMVGSIKG